MAFSHINSNAEIWKRAGLKYIFYPDGVPEASSPQRATDSAYGDKTRFSRPPMRRQEVQKRSPTPKASRPASPRLKETEAFIDPDAMRDDWRVFLGNAKKGLIAWTYPELGEDLSSARMERTDVEKEKFAARRGFISRILKELNHPAGTHTFIPPVPGAWNPENFSSSQFFSALNILNCRGLLIFGSSTGQLLFPERKLRPLVSWMRGELFVWVLRDINILSEPNSSYYTESVAYLREALRRFAR